MVAGREADGAVRPVAVPGHAVAGLLVEDLDVVEGVAVGGVGVAVLGGDVGVEREGGAVAGAHEEGVGGVVVALCGRGVAGVEEVVDTGALDGSGSVDGEWFIGLKLGV